MRQPHDREDHDPPRLIRLALVALAALCAAGPASAAQFAALPSPVAPLSASPPLGTGAAASAENTRHRVDARTAVAVSVDARGAPFAIVATQRLDVRILGDYYFTVGAPVTDVERAAGSASAPGLRKDSIVWAGFNPGHRVLAARATLDAAAASPSLPLRISVSDGRTVLVNATGVDVGTFTADAERPSLIRFLGDLRSRVAHGLLPIGGNASVTSTPVAKRVHVVAPLRVTGTIGARRVSLVLRGRTSIPTAGRIALTVRPVVAVPDRDVSSLGGRALLDYASLVSLTIARARQYETFLGNPDPTGRIATTYVFRSGHRAAAAPVISPRSHRSYTLLWLLAAAAALAGGAFVWARS